MFLKKLTICWQRYGFIFDFCFFKVKNIQTIRIYLRKRRYTRIFTTSTKPMQVFCRFFLENIWNFNLKVVTLQAKNT